MLTEKQARMSNTCICGAPKSSGEGGCVVCWDCFKGGKIPLKYFNGTFEQWQKARAEIAKAEK